MVERKRYWLGEVKNCDLCEKEFGTRGDLGIIFIDGKTNSGSWAIMCVNCYYDHGVGLGVGKGQAYELQRSGEDEGKWLKIA